MMHRRVAGDVLPCRVVSPTTTELQAGAFGLRPVALPRPDSLCSLHQRGRRLFDRAGALRGTGLYNALGRAGWSHPGARPSLCALEALRCVVGGETMTTPGGTRTACYVCLNLPVLGAPASIMGSEPPGYRAPAFILSLAAPS